MIFTLDLTGLPTGYGESVLPVTAAKLHLRVIDDEEDALIEALRDAAVLMVENYTGLVLAPRTGADAMVWRAEALPGGTTPALLGVRPVTDILTAAYLDAAGVAQSVDVSTLRVVDGDKIAPNPGSLWPTDVAAGVVISFEAGLASPPPPLVTAAKMFLATLFSHRESVVTGTIVDELPHGFKELCWPYRRLKI